MGACERQEKSSESTENALQSIAVSPVSVYSEKEKDFVVLLPRTMEVGSFLRELCRKDSVSGLETHGLLFTRTLHTYLH